jgi:hypothetical protein
LGPAEVTVLDAGWGALEVLTGHSWLAQAAESAAVVLVARATIPALRQLERALATCPGAPVVALVGGHSRSARSVQATVGRMLEAAQSAGRVVAVPNDRHLAVTGITCDPLPKALVQAGQQIFTGVLAAGNTGGAEPSGIPATHPPRIGP